MKLKIALVSDLELMMAWRSNPLVYEGFVQQCKPLTWEEHSNWFESRNRDWRTFIIEYMNRKIGVVTIGQLDHWSPEIGYYIGEISLWGQGLGRKAVELALDYLKENGYNYCHTTVIKKNTRSLNLLKGLGFKILGDARKGEVWLQSSLK